MGRRIDSLVIPEVLLRLGKWGYPFLLVDRLVDFEEGIRGHIDVIKNVSFNEPYFVGHFPHSPIMPGVLIAEIFGQASDYHILLSEFRIAYEARHGETIDSNKRLSEALHTPEGLALVDTIKSSTLGYLASQNLRFKRRVQPGDVITARCKLTRAEPTGFLHYGVEAHVDGQPVCTGRIVNFRTNNLGAGRGLSGGYRMDADYNELDSDPAAQVTRYLGNHLDAVSKGT